MRVRYAQLAMLNMQAANNHTNLRLTCHRSCLHPHPLCQLSGCGQ